MIVGKHGYMNVHPSRSIWRRAAPGSKCVMLMNVPPASRVDEQQEQPGHVEEGQRIPELLVLREPEAVHDPRGRAHERPRA